MDLTNLVMFLAFDPVQPGVDIFLNVLRGRGDLFADVVGLFFTAPPQILIFRLRTRTSTVAPRSCGIFRIAPGLFCSALELLSGSGVGQFLVSDTLADLLLDLPCNLVEFSCNFALVHPRTPFFLMGRTFIVGG